MVPDPFAREEEAAVREWTGLAHWIACDFTFPDGDRDDVRQEALVGLLSGLRSYRPDVGGGCKKAFLSMVIRRRLSSQLRQRQRAKRGPVSTALRVGVDEDGETVSLVELLPDRREPGDACERLRLFHERLPTLTQRERVAVVGLAIGCDYAELGQPKAIDNAYQRGMRKLRALDAVGA